MLKYDKIESLVDEAERKKLTISQLVLEDQAEQLGMKPEDVFARMDQDLKVMEKAVWEGKNPELKSASGLTGGDAARIEAYGNGLAGSVFNGAIMRAVAVAEYNAAMGKIVAAPTAGSCGILPGAVITMMEEKGYSREKAVMGLITAGAIGMVIANKASIAGAEGGCQAECGSASAMAAAALVEMAGGTPSMCAHACAIALKCQMGLVCDPVAGLVEIPCIKRNAGGVSIALMAAEMALAGIESKIPADEVVLSMKEVGDSMPCSLRETAKGGIAVSPTGLRMKEQVFGKKE